MAKTLCNRCGVNVAHVCEACVDKASEVCVLTAWSKASWPSAEIEARTGVPSATLRRWRKTGRVRYYNRGKMSYMCLEDVLRAQLELNRVVPRAGDDAGRAAHP